jgi:hypothetical protein
MHDMTLSIVDGIVVLQSLGGYYKGCHMPLGYMTSYEDSLF